VRTNGNDEVVARAVNLLLGRAALAEIRIVRAALGQKHRIRDALRRVRSTAHSGKIAAAQRTDNEGVRRRYGALPAVTMKLAGKEGREVSTITLRTLPSTGGPHAPAVVLICNMPEHSCDDIFRRLSSVR
jgi:hypothetical protein